MENLTDTARSIKVVPYLEWVLNRPRPTAATLSTTGSSPRWNTQADLHAVLAWDKHAKAMGVLASDHAPEGFLSSRIDFIGRARSLWTPRVLETLAFSEPRDTPAHPTLDPIGSLLIGMTIPARGLFPDPPADRACQERSQAIDLIARHLQVRDAELVASRPVQQELRPPDRARRDPARRARNPTPSSPRTAGSCWSTRLSHPGPLITRCSNVLGHVAVVTNRGSAHKLERQLPAEPSDARLGGYRHAGSSRRGVLPLRSRRGRVVLADLSPSQRRRRIA